MKRRLAHSVLGIGVLCLVFAGSSLGAEASALYMGLCAQCHGERGDGDTAVGRFLLPLPRDFTRLQFKLVTTDNKQPSDSDLDWVIRNGMPGTGMPAFSALTAKERQTLVQDVRRLGVSGWKQKNPNQVPPSAGQTLTIHPPNADALSGLIERGSAIYASHCAVCHGASGRGDGPAGRALQDARGDPNLPRNFLDHPLRGGSEPTALFARIKNGMPGSSMPASPLPDEDIWAVVQFLRASFLK